MRYILLLVVILGVVAYIFLVGPKPKSQSGAYDANRRQEVWEKISSLERQRQTMLLLARWRLADYDAYSERPRLPGFSTFLSWDRKADSLFFPLNMQ